jgi:hypothetical protein
MQPTDGSDARLHPDGLVAETALVDEVLAVAGQLDPHHEVGGWPEADSVPLCDSSVYTAVR